MTVEAVDYGRGWEILALAWNVEVYGWEPNMFTPYELLFLSSEALSGTRITLPPLGWALIMSLNLNVLGVGFVLLI